MATIIASTICVIGILGLFYLDRGGSPRLSQALWIPALWLATISSRPPSFWLGIKEGSLTAVDASQAYVEGSPVERAFFTVLIVVALAVLVARARRVAPTLRKNALLLSYLLFCLMSVFWSDFPFVAFKRWTKIIGDVAMVLIILTDTHPLVALKRLVSRLSFLLFPVSIILIKYYPRLGRRETNSWTEEPVGVAAQKNSLGLICLIYGVLLLWMFWSAYRDREDRSRSRRLVAYGTILAMIASLLYQCNSTTSIVGLTATAGVMWLAMRPSRKPAFVHASVFAVLAISVIALFFDPSKGMVVALGKSPTFSGRTLVWKLILGLHTNPLIGTGFESFWLGHRIEAMREALPNFPINEAHNGWLELYINLGWVGVCFIGGLIVTAYKRVMSHFRRAPATATLFLGFLLCTLFNSFSENAFRIMTPSWFFLVIVIVASSRSELFENVQMTIQTHHIERDGNPRSTTTTSWSLAENANRY